MKALQSSLLQPLLALGSIASLATADTITGQVVDSNGVGVPNVNIAGIDLDTGDDAVISNGSTNGNGVFSATLPGGNYKLLFEPPPPPTTTFVVGVIPSVNVNGSRNLGTIELEDGVSLAGRITDPNHAGVLNANLDVRRQPTDEVVELVGDNTDANGNFRIAVPSGSIELRVDPTPVSGQILAATFRELTLGGNTDLGTIQLERGWVVSGLVRRTNGSGVSGADLDAEDSNTGVKLFTPSDNTDNNGFFDFVVAAGTYDFEVCAKVSDRLVTQVLTGRPISGNTNLGVITMQPGLRLSGHVQGTGNEPIRLVDLDLIPIGQNDEIPTCHDNTDEAGNYAFIVPAGTYDIRFTPLRQDPYCPIEIAGFSIGGDRTLNATLPDALGTRYCTANANSTGSSAEIFACGSTSSSAGDLTLTSTPVPNQPGIFFHGDNQIQVTFGNGFLCVGGDIKRGRIAFGSGNVATYTYDNSHIKRDLSAHIGTTRRFQHWFRDPMGGGAQFNLSNAVSLNILP